VSATVESDQLFIKLCAKVVIISIIAKISAESLNRAGIYIFFDNNDYH
jgi:hypothetical protein